MTQRLDPEKHAVERQRHGRLTGLTGKEGSSDYYSMLDIIEDMTPGEDGSHNYNEALLFQQLRRSTGSRWR